MMKTCNILINGTSLDPPIHVLVYEDFFNRLKGLMFRRQISDGEGIVIAQRKDSRLDASIHMLFVFMDLGIVWIDAQMNVVDKIIAKSWKPIYLPSHPAKYILEINPKRISEIQVNDKVQLNEIK